LVIEHHLPARRIEAAERLQIVPCRARPAVKAQERGPSRDSRIAHHAVPDRISAELDGAFRNRRPGHDRNQPSDAPYYRRDLALVHHLGFGFHADLVAPGILKLLEPIRARNGLVVELGCGSGLLTRHLHDAGHRVVATDASPAMLALARQTVPDADGLAQLVLPDDPIPDCDAIVSVGHPLSYLPDEKSIDRAFIAAADALDPGGVLAVDICDLEWGVSRRDAPNLGRVGENWAVITEFSMPSPNRFVRQMAVFVRNDDGS
jgi:SAM-dependent methyltransferase